MSNNTNSFELDVPVTETVDEVATEAVEETAAQPKKKKNVAARIFSLLFAALCVGVFFLPVSVYKNGAWESCQLYGVIMDIIGGGAPYTLFGVLPCYADPATLNGMLTALMLYVLGVSLVLAFLFGFFGIFTAKTAKGMLRTTTFFTTVGFVAYALHTLLMTNLDMQALDLVTLAAAGVSLLTYIVVSAVKVCKKAWMNVIQCVLTLGAVFAAMYIVINNVAIIENGLTAFGLTDMATLILQIVCGVLALIALLAVIRVQQKWGLGLDMLRYIVNLAIGGLICYFAITASAEGLVFIMAIAAAAAPLLQIIFCAFQMGAAKKAKKKAVVVVEEEPVEEYVVEEYAEALPYDGGPVEGVEIAQEAIAEETEPEVLPAPVVAPVEEPVAAPAPEVNTAGYDFYNSKAFDPFIAILSGEERNQFTELFILKFKGAMVEIPDYVVGGDNKDFFRKVFIYLGQYRDRIPDGLLSKIYQFAIKM